MKPRSIIGYILAAIGVALVLCTVAYHFWVDYTASLAGQRAVHEFMWIPLATGAVLGWWGFYWVDSTRAVRGGDFLLKAKDRMQRVRLEPIENTPLDRRSPPADRGEGDEEGITPTPEVP